MARPRKPDELKRITGTLQNCRVNQQAPKPGYGFPVPPTYLTAEELKAWNQACQLLDGMGVLAIEDAFAVEELAVCKAQLLALRQDIIANGTCYTAPDSGLEKTRPQVRMEQDTSRHFLTLLGKFGLTPESHSKVNAKTGQDDNPFDSL
jgi:P27 family predicted phage terminase small subunit